MDISTPIAYMIDLDIYAIDLDISIIDLDICDRSIIDRSIKNHVHFSLIFTQTAPHRVAQCVMLQHHIMYDNSM